MLLISSSRKTLACIVGLVPGLHLYSSFRVCHASSWEAVHQLDLVSWPWSFIYVHILLPLTEKSLTRTWPIRTIKKRMRQTNDKINWNGKRQLLGGTRNIEVFGFGASYIIVLMYVVESRDEFHLCCLILGIVLRSVAGEKCTFYLSSNAKPLPSLSFSYDTSISEEQSWIKTNFIQ